jgi:hypothetical protein
MFVYYGRSKPKESNAKETILFHFIWCDVRVYLYQKIYMSWHIKNVNIIKMIKLILIYMKFVISTKHCDLTIWLE